MAKNYLVGLVGEGIEHSLTPDLHMREAQHLGFDYQFRLIDTLSDSLQGNDLAWIIAELKNARYDAINVTFPYKQKVFDHVLSTSVEVSDLDSLNLILDLQGNPRGENTDWSGFAFALDQGLADVERDSVIQIGVGGAGSATAYALLRWGVSELTLADLNFPKANEIAQRFNSLFPNQKVTAVTLENALEKMYKVDGVVQATPVGMYTHPGLPFSIDGLSPKAWLADVVYRPMETEIIKLGRERGHRVLPGGLMAIGQAVDSLRLITGKEPDVARMTAHFEELLADESVLTRARGI